MALIGEGDEKRLVEELKKRFGCDYFSYSDVHIRAKLRRIYKDLEFDTFGRLLKHFEITGGYDVLMKFSQTYKEFFRDPVFLKQLRKKLKPLARNLPLIKIWVPECGDGMELLSLIILFIEAEVYDRIEIVASDINPFFLQKARLGIYPSDKLDKYRQNYEDAGGMADFMDYFTEKKNFIQANPSIMLRVTFIKHHMVDSLAFDKFHMIYFRNILLYYRSELRNTILNKLSQSLLSRGILCLGQKENTDNLTGIENFKRITGNERVFQKL
ncbi:MAG: hypothetical protein C0594_15495 [Marinilabiliales bacterium]|nr:MAG: hypothetical protein C0594_15495 [Marinilabiliales bacterium]